MPSTIPKIYATLISQEYQQTLFASLAQLQRKGRGFIAKCPFHEDSLPTFLIYGDRPEFFCFACSERGDWIDYLMRTGKRSFEEALSTLQEASGVFSKDHSCSRWEEDLYWTGILEKAMDSFIAKLWSKQGEETLHYLYARGYAMGEVEGMSLGHYPGFEETRNDLLKQGFEPKRLEELLKRFWNELPDKQGVVIPYRDASGRLMALMHRDICLKGPDSYRFLTDEGHVRDVPFLMYHSLSQTEIIVVEGLFDALLLDQARLKPVIGIGRGGLKPSLLETAVSSGARHFIMALGNGEAQKAATRDSIHLIKAAGYRASVLPIPAQFRDIDEYIRGTCLDHFKALLRKAMDSDDWLKKNG